MLWRINQAPRLTMRFATVSCIMERGGGGRQVHRGGIYHGEGIRHTPTGKRQAAEERRCMGGQGGAQKRAVPWEKKIPIGDPTVNLLQCLQQQPSEHPSIPAGERRAGSS